MESQPDLEIQLLGTFRLTYRGQLVRNVLTKRLVALLAYLLINRHELIPRQRLAFLFWPDTGEAQARTNLRRLLHQLREVFPSIKAYLRSEPTYLSWNHASPYRLDIAEFEVAADQARDISDLQKAVDLYQDDILPDLYDDWVQVERERLGKVYEDLLVRLAYVEEENGNYPSAIRAGQRLLQHDPLREETYRILMRLHSRMGARTGIRRVYNTCKAVLRRELEVDPGPETEAAYQIWLQQVTSRSSKSDQITASLQQRKTNLPALLDTLIGRGEDLEQVKNLVMTKRLVTLTGFGGVGKTRLALAIAAELHGEYPKGIYWIDLAQLENSALLTQVIADVLGVQVDNRRLIVDRLIEFIASKRMLLVVDNCEHLIEAAGHFIEQVLKTCRELHILTTSRISLRIPGEIIYQVQPLPVPTLYLERSDGSKLSIESLRQNFSVRLFTDRARSLLPTFSLHEKNCDAVAQICRRLEGIPLALELAAGRIRILEPQGIARRLDDVFQLLSGGKNLLPRHQTLQATLDWSYTLLSEKEQTLLHRLAVFAGTFTLDDAEAVAIGEGNPASEVLERLAGLIDHSLVAVESLDDERYYRLHEITRQYALQKLQSEGEEELFRAGHLSYFCSMAEQAEPSLRNHQQIHWIQKLDLQVANLRAALEWGAQQRQKDMLELALRLAGALWLYWFIRGHFVEGFSWMERLLVSREQISIHPAVMGKAFYTAASFAFFLGDIKKAQAYTDEGRVACEQVKDLSGRAISLHHLGLITLNSGNMKQAEQYYREGLELAQNTRNDWLMSLFFHDLAIRFIQEEEYQSARHFLLEELAISRKLGDRFGMVYALNSLGSLALEANDLQQALFFSHESYKYSQEIGETRGVAFSLDIQAHIASLQNRPDEAKKLWLESLAILWEARNLLDTLDIMEALAKSVNFYDDPTAVCLLATSQSMREKFELPSIESSLPRQVNNYLGHLRIKMGEGAFTQAWERGQNLSMEDAVHLAGS